MLRHNLNRERFSALIARSMGSARESMPCAQMPCTRNPHLSPEGSTCGAAAANPPNDFMHACSVGDIHPSDICQGQVGDCWLMSALACLAHVEGAIPLAFHTREVRPRCVDTYHAAMQGLIEPPASQSHNVLHGVSNCHHGCVIMECLHMLMMCALLPICTAQRLRQIQDPPLRQAGRQEHHGRGGRLHPLQERQLSACVCAAKRERGLGAHPGKSHGQVLGEDKNMAI
jgi:hypothetical protein